MSTKNHVQHHADYVIETDKKRETPQSESPSVANRTLNHDERSHSIQLRAYSLWEQAGKPEGDATREQFWLEAEQEAVRSKLPPEHGKVCMSPAPHEQTVSEAKEVWSNEGNPI